MSSWVEINRKHKTIKENGEYRKLESTENRMIHKMYGLKEGMPVEKMIQNMGVAAINDAIKLGRLRWFGHVKRRRGKLSKEMHGHGDRGQES